MAGSLLIASELKEESKVLSFGGGILHQHLGFGIFNLAQNLLAEAIGDEGHLQSAAVAVVCGCDEIRHVVCVEVGGITRRIQREVYRSGDRCGCTIGDCSILTSDEKSVVDIFQSELDFVISHRGYTSIS